MSEFLPPTRRNLVFGIKTGLPDCRLVFLDLEAIEIIRRLLATRGLYLSTYYAERLENGYARKLTASQFNVVEEIVSRALYQLGDDKMACAEEVILALEGISASIELSAESGGCGSGDCEKGSGGADSTDVAEEDFIDDGSSTFPELFSDRASYTDKKCGIARGIIDQMLADLLWLETISLVNISVTAFVTALFTPIPGTRIVALVSMVLTLFLQATLLVVVQAVRAAINSQIETLICALMDATDSSDAQGDFLTELALSGVEATFVAIFVNNVSFNRLFNYGDTPGGYDPCSCADDCGCGVEVTLGTTTDDIRFIAEDAGSAWGVSIIVNTQGGTDNCVDTCGAETTFVIDSLVGHTPTTATQDYQVISYPSACDSGVSVWGSNTPWDASLTGRVFQIWSSTAFVLWRSC